MKKPLPLHMSDSSILMQGSNPVAIPCDRTGTHVIDSPNIGTGLAREDAIRILSDMVRAYNASLSKADQ